MDKKTHGPAFVRCLIPLTDCPSCTGKGIIQGVFHQLDCIGCHASGLVHAESLEPLLLEDLVVQLGMKVRNLAAQLRAIDCTNQEREGRHYQQDNRRGPGASTYKGD